MVFAAAFIKIIKKYAGNAVALPAKGHRVSVDTIIVGSLSAWDPANNVQRDLQIAQNGSALNIKY